MFLIGNRDSMHIFSRVAKIILQIIFGKAATIKINYELHNVPSPVDSNGNPSSPLSPTPTSPVARLARERSMKRTAQANRTGFKTTILQFWNLN